MPLRFTTYRVIRINRIFFTIEPVFTQFFGCWYRFTVSPSQHGNSFFFGAEFPFSDFCAITRMSWIIARNVFIVYSQSLKNKIYWMYKQFGLIRGSFKQPTAVVIFQTACWLTRSMPNVVSENFLRFFLFFPLMWFSVEGTVWHCGYDYTAVAGLLIRTRIQFSERCEEKNWPLFSWYGFPSIEVGHHLCRLWLLHCPLLSFCGNSFG